MIIFPFIRHGRLFTLLILRSFFKTSGGGLPAETQQLLKFLHWQITSRPYQCQNTATWFVIWRGKIWMLWSYHRFYICGEECEVHMWRSSYRLMYQEWACSYLSGRRSAWPYDAALRSDKSWVTTLVWLSMMFGIKMSLKALKWQFLEILRGRDTACVAHITSCNQWGWSVFEKHCGCTTGTVSGGSCECSASLRPVDSPSDSKQHEIGAVILNSG